MATSGEVRAGEMPGMGAAVAALSIEVPGEPSRVVAMQKARYTLGRSSMNDLSFPADMRLSREHLVLERTGECWTVKDLDSQNGTRVNGVLAKASVRLANGDCIQAGRLSLTYCDKDGPVARAPRGVTFIEQGSLGQPTAWVDLKSAQSALAAGSSTVTKGRDSAHLRALMRAGRDLAALASVEAVSETALDIALEAVRASRGVLMMATRNGEFTIRARRGDEFRISTAVRDVVVGQARSLLINDVSWDQEFAAQPSIVAQKIRSIAAVPLETNERVIGLLYLDSADVVGDFTAEDLSLLTVIANIAAIRMEHARLMEQESARKLLDQDLERAADIQRKLLPSKAPLVPGFDVAGFNAPCRSVGGDYFDFLPYPEDRMAVVIGDVSGKGMGAALLMSGLQARAQVLFDSRDPLDAEVTRLNQSISSSCPANCFITFFIGVLEPESGRLTYCNAGHNAPLVLRSDGSAESLAATGMPLGISRAATYQEQSCIIHPGDILLLFSDGITEACDTGSDDEFGEQRLIGLLRECESMPAAAVLERIRGQVLQFASGAAADDMTLVMVRRNH